MPFLLFKRAFQRAARRPAPPPGMRIYVVGDIHGRDDLLEEIAKAIRSDLASAPSERLTILLGDYVDRGPGSAKVVGRLADGDFPTPILALRGNHEQMLLQFLEDPSKLDAWRRYGGLETLYSYGVDVSESMRGQGFETACEALLAAMPEAHRRFLETTEPYAAFGDYFFCHAGVRPGVPLDRQRPEDLMWIRERFLRFQGSFGKVVVHGHTPVAAPDFHGNRINIDTGAFATSVLTCLVLEGAERRLLTVGRRQG